MQRRHTLFSQLLLQSKLCGLSGQRHRSQFDDLGQQRILRDLQADLREEVGAVPRDDTTALAPLQVGASRGLMLFSSIAL